MKSFKKIAVFSMLLLVIVSGINLESEFMNIILIDEPIKGHH